MESHRRAGIESLSEIVVVSGTVPFFLRRLSD